MLLLIDKPKGITSHDVVDIVRRATKVRRVGHAGTLDPMATGLLIVGIGRESTKKLGDLTKNTRKTYIATIKLGEETDTLDAEGKVVKTMAIPPLNEAIVRAVLDKFTGDIKQVPPAFSAIKVLGKKSYDLARKGEMLELPAREVSIHGITLLKLEEGLIEIECEVSAGTYIRSLARDISNALGTCGHLVALRRTKIGEYDIASAKSIEELTAYK